MPCPVLTCGGLDEERTLPQEIDSVLVENMFVKEEQHSALVMDAKHKILEFVRRNAREIHPFDIGQFLFETLRT